jgi:hypothetical protein
MQMWKNHRGIIQQPEKQAQCKLRMPEGKTHGIIQAQVTHVQHLEMYASALQ